MDYKGTNRDFSSKGFRTKVSSKSMYLDGNLILSLANRLSHTNLNINQYSLGRKHIGGRELIRSSPTKTVPSNKIIILLLDLSRMILLTMVNMDIELNREVELSHYKPTQYDSPFVVLRGYLCPLCPL